MRLILGLVGQIAAGKGSVSKYLSEKYQANFYHFSTPLRKTLHTFELEESRKNMAKLSIFLRKNFGNDLLAKIITADIKNDKNKIIAVDSVRRAEDIKYLKDLPEFKLLYIKADMKTRYKRLIERGENYDDKEKTYKEFLADNQLEGEREIEKIGSNAELVVDNSGSLELLHEQIDKIIKSEIKN